MINTKNFNENSRAIFEAKKFHRIDDDSLDKIQITYDAKHSNGETTLSEEITLKCDIKGQWSISLGDLGIKKHQTQQEAIDKLSDSLERIAIALKAGTPIDIPGKSGSFIDVLELFPKSNHES